MVPVPFDAKTVRRQNRCGISCILRLARDAGGEAKMAGIKINHVCAAAWLSAALLQGAVTQVNLSPSATPAVADPGVTSITVIGHNFPSGTIPPANVTVTLNP